VLNICKTSVGVGMLMLHMDWKVHLLVTGKESNKLINSLQDYKTSTNLMLDSSGHRRTVCLMRDILIAQRSAVQLASD
jgi:hypothetical protein